MSALTSPVKRPPYGSASVLARERLFGLGQFPSVGTVVILIFMGAGSAGENITRLTAIVCRLHASYLIEDKDVDRCNGHLTRKRR